MPSHRIIPGCRAQCGEAGGFTDDRPVRMPVVNNNQGTDCRRNRALKASCICAVSGASERNRHLLGRRVPTVLQLFEDAAKLVIAVLPADDERCARHTYEAAGCDDDADVVGGD
jgi:hypothetical protein